MTDTRLDRAIELLEAVVKRLDVIVQKLDDEDAFGGTLGIAAVELQSISTRADDIEEHVRRILDRDAGAD
ncbi:MAG TPA: hypothetical protein VLW49_09580 [Gaiellaceae bacterium]|nr:hypothetical protein [Gaiellaceae bacterium]